MMNYSEIIQALEGASGFDLFRLQTAIDRMLDDPQRVIEVRHALRVGEEIEYFDAGSNRPVAARLLEFRRTRVAVQNIDDGKRWSIPYYTINIHKVDTAIHGGGQNRGLDRNELGVGEMVGFLDRENRERYGKVIRLNPKTVTLQCEQEQWRVAYSLLFKVLAPAAEQLPPS